MFYKIGALKKCTWKQLISVSLIKKTPVQVLSREFCEIFKNPFWQNTFRQLLLDVFHSFTCFLPPSELIETRFFLFLNMFNHGFHKITISISNGLKYGQEQLSRGAHENIYWCQVSHIRHEAHGFIIID